MVFSYRGPQLFSRIQTVLVMVALLLSSLPFGVAVTNAASTGITLSDYGLITAVDTQVNFQVSKVNDGSPTQGTYVLVTDDGGGGDFFDSNGNCSNASPDSDNQFPLQNNKNICYSNGTPGVYSVSAQLLDAEDGNPIGVPAFVSITVTEEAGDDSNQGGSGAIWTNTGPCGSPQNVNQYEVGQDFYGHGSNFRPNAIYTWVAKDPGDNGQTLGTGSLTTDENGDFCEKLFTVADEHVGGPYQFKVDGKNDNFSVNARVVEEADLAIEKTVSTTTPEEGTEVTYTLTVSNSGPDTATDVVVTDPLASGLTYQSASVSPDSTSPLTWNLGSLADGASWSVEVVALIGVDQGGVAITNTASVVSDTSDSSNLNNTDSITILPFGGDSTGTLVVIKNVIGESQPNYADFSFTINGVSTTTFATGNTVSLTVPTGVYTVTEVPVAGYDVAHIRCDEVLVSANATTTCTINNTVQTPTPTQCVAGTDIWSTEVEDYAQGLRKDGTAVLLARSDANLALDESDWSTGGSSGFFSLGFAGEITLTFSGYINDEPGDDVFVYEATNGSYPAETALVEVSQDGIVWHTLGTAGQLSNSFDLADSGLLWAEYVRLTDTSNPLSHNNDADGFDLDAVRVAEVVCETPTPEVDTYRLEGYVWHDDNKNTEWDGLESEDQEELIEESLAGWTVNIVNASSSYSTSTVTDETGYYFFEVPAGTWVITEVVQEGWERTTQESYTVTVPEEEVAQGRSSFWSWFIPTAHAALLATYGDYNFGNDTVETVITDTDTNSSSSGSRSSGSRPRSQVRGVTNVPLPTPLVLGEQVSVVPVGAPDTGRGGAASQKVVFSMLQLFLSR